MRHRGFTAAAIVSLALGIGANTAMFGLVNLALLKELRVEDPNLSVRTITTLEDQIGNTLNGERVVATLLTVRRARVDDCGNDRRDARGFGAGGMGAGPARGPDRSDDGATV